MKIGVLGAGTWGMALASLLVGNILYIFGVIYRVW